MMGNSRQSRNSRHAGAVRLPVNRLPVNRLPQRLLAAAVLLAVGMLVPRWSAAQFMRLALDIVPFTAIQTSETFLPMVQYDFDTQSEVLEGTLVMSFSTDENLQVLVTRGDQISQQFGQVSFAYRNDGHCYPVTGIFGSEARFSLSKSGQMARDIQGISNRVNACLYVRVRMPLQQENPESGLNAVHVKIEYN
jgi:hypothetical protein